MYGISGRSALADYKLERLWSAETFGASHDLGTNRPNGHERRTTHLVRQRRKRSARQSPKSKESSARIRPRRRTVNRLFVARKSKALRISCHFCVRFCHWLCRGCIRNDARSGIHAGSATLHVYRAPFKECAPVYYPSFRTISRHVTHTQTCSGFDKTCVSRLS